MAESAVWRDWTLAALARRPDGHQSQDEVLEEVAVLFADRFGPNARTFDAPQSGGQQNDFQGEPRWQLQVRHALSDLAADNLITDAQAPGLTDAGRAQIQMLPEHLSDEPAADPTSADADGSSVTAGSLPRSPLITAGVIAPPLRTATEREKIGFATDADEPIQIMTEINMQFGGGPGAAWDRLRRLWLAITQQPGPFPLSEQYAGGQMSMNQVKRLVAADAVPLRWPYRSLQRVWPDFPVQPHIDRSGVTVKSDAAQRTFNAYGEGIIWAVIDTGIWAHHPHFCSYQTLDHPDVKDLHRAFTTNAPPAPVGALTDEDGHGTHVAGIIAGGAIPSWVEAQAGRTVQVTESRLNVENSSQPSQVPRHVADLSTLAGVAPRTRLVSLKALAGYAADNGVGKVIQALAYVRQVNNGGGDGLRIHGVNLSVGYDFDPQWFACGQSPLCKEVDKLVRTGVVVVVAAGNSGHGTLSVTGGAPRSFGLSMTINDPGNSELAITVGSTHRDAPHTYGISFFSSKGPTGDGRQKPDLVAPGERITSCAAGTRLPAAEQTADPSVAAYVEDSGTSMAAPHVSGAAAALLSVRREYIGRPDLVKKVILDTAIDLGRGHDFQGAGLLDVIGAIAAI